MFEDISKKLIERAKKIKLIGFDVDGVLTDGSIFIGESGEVFKKYSSLDGHGMKLALKFGIQVCIISARNSPSVHTRFKDFGFEDNVYTGIEDKWTQMQKIMKKYHLQNDEVAFIGDDALDIPVLEKVGLAVCPPNRHFSVDKHVHYITEHGGGFGAAREFVDFILVAQNKIPCD
jgi:3-deoxy-D-manno-octulosonate 8-phosphate phosphatase (KDO 8-P phosphatase)